MKWFVFITFVSSFLFANNDVYFVPEHQQHNIRKLITKLGYKDYLELMVKYRAMNRLGDQIDREVKPMEFISYIISQPDLKLALQRVRKSTLKWNRFSEGFGEKMQIHYSREELREQLPKLSRFLNVPLHELERLARKKNWKGFLKVLIR